MRYFFQFTHVKVGFALLLMPDCYVEALFGKVSSRRRINKLLSEFWAQSPPFRCRLLLGMLVDWMQVSVGENEYMLTAETLRGIPCYLHFNKWIC